MKSDEHIVDRVESIGHRGCTFKYTQGSKTYFLKRVNADSHEINNHDVILETPNLPYIVKAYRVLYNSVVLKGNKKHEYFWILSEYLEIPSFSIDWSDMNVVKQFIHDALKGLYHFIHKELFIIIFT